MAALLNALLAEFLKGSLVAKEFLVESWESEGEERNLLTITH